MDRGDIIAALIVIGIIVGIIAGAYFLFLWLLVGLFSLFFNLQVAGGVGQSTATTISIILVVVLVIFCCCRSSD